MNKFGIPRLVLPQSLGATASPTFADLTDSGLSASQAVMTDGSKKLVSADYLDQAVKATSSPNFTTVTVSGAVDAGALTGLTPIILSTGHKTLTAAQCKGQILFITPISLVTNTLAINSSKALTDSANGFLTAGFAPGQQVQLSGFTAEGNTCTKIISTVAQGTIVFTSTTGLEAEEAGDTVTVLSNYVILPPVVIGSVVTVYSTVAALIHVDPDAADLIILNGVALHDGDKISSASGVGDFATMVGALVSGWTVVGRSGTWTDGGTG
jgi:hypothetical protein